MPRFFLFHRLLWGVTFSISLFSIHTRGTLENISRREARKEGRAKLYAVRAPSCTYKRAQLRKKCVSSRIVPRYYSAADAFFASVSFLSLGGPPAEQFPAWRVCAYVTHARMERERKKGNLPFASVRAPPSLSSSSFQTRGGGEAAALISLISPRLPATVRGERMYFRPIGETLSFPS